MKNLDLNDLKIDTFDSADVQEELAPISVKP